MKHRQIDKQEIDRQTGGIIEEAVQSEQTRVTQGNTERRTGWRVQILPEKRGGGRSLVFKSGVHTFNASKGKQKLADL